MRRQAICLFVALLMPASSLFALDMVRDSVPARWVEPNIPEKFPAIKLKAYQKDPVEIARIQAFRGRYKLALMTLRQAKPGSDPAGIALAKGMALSGMGRMPEALAALSEPAAAANPKVQVLKARVLADSGKTSDALAVLNDHLATNPDSIAGRYWMGAILEQAGQMEKAEQAYAWFNDKPQDFMTVFTGGDMSRFASAEDVVLIGRAMDRFVTLKGYYANNRQMHDVVLSFFTKAYDRIDPEYWPAHAAAAEYFLNHHNEKETGKELTAALAGNPQDEQSLLIVGMVALSKFEFDRADAVAAQVRAFNPTSVGADLLDVRNLLQQRKPRDAEEVAKAVLKQQPQNIDAMGLLAATYALRLHTDEMNKVLAEVDKLAPQSATALLVVAEQLGAMRQYPRAAEKYQEAIKRAPWWTDAHNGLGLLYTQSGDEDRARVALEQARLLDSFNYRTNNYLKLLDLMDKMAKAETEHFTVMYDKDGDPLIPIYFGEYLESIHAAVTARFQAVPETPDRKTLIEIFPQHDQFSVRTTGAPWIGTVGASTGRVIAMVSPRKGDSTLGNYNFAQVLRHEYTHTVTLAATDNRIAHWQTEGLAVSEERVPVRWEWVPMLYQAVTKKELFTMDGLTWGFVRPKKPSDRQLAYAQSWWVCDFIEKTWGTESTVKMLNEFRSGKLQDEVFQKVLNISIPDFEKKFFAWADEQVAGWGYDEATSKKYNGLKDKADAMVKAKKYPEAIAAWEEIVKIRPVDALPHMRLAGLYLATSQPEKEIPHLIRLHQVSLKDGRFAKRLARVYRDLGKMEESQQMAMQAIYIEPYDMDAHILMAEIAEKVGNMDMVKREQLAMEKLEKWQADEKVRTAGAKPPAASGM